MLVDIPYDPAHTCCFSGSRPEKLGFDWQHEPYFFDVLRTDLRAAIRHAVDLEYRRFITGMSRGFDLWAAEEVINLQREFPHLQLIAAIRHAVDLEYRRFITGMSRGFDLWAAEEVINLQREFPHLQLIAAIPFAGMETRWEPYWRNLFAHAHQGADYEVYLSDRFLPGCYHARDNYMVQQSSRIICWNNGTLGGTAYTCQYAERRGITSDRFLPGCYHARDNYMVQQSSRIICWNNGTLGGTAYTCQYAERRGITLDNIHRPYYSLSSMP